MSPARFRGLAINVDGTPISEEGAGGKNGFRENAIDRVLVAATKTKGFSLLPGHGD